MMRPKIALFLILTSLLATPVFAQTGSAPTAVLKAPQSIAFGAPLTLNGAQSLDSDGSIIRYIWTKLTGVGGAMTLNQAFGTLEPTFLVPQPSGRPLAIGRHRFRLVVNDNSGNQSSPDEFEVIVVDSTAPTAVLDAPASVAFGAPLQLSGAQSSDTVGRVVRYVWTHVQGSGSGFLLNQPLVTDVNNLIVPQPAGNPLAVGRHVFRLTVTDDAGNQSQPVDRQVLVVDNVAPTAVLEAPKQVLQLQPFQLSGASSRDSGGRIFRFEWLRISGSTAGPMPLGQPVVTDTNALSVVQSLTSYLGIGRHVFRLVVVDDSGNKSAPADFSVDVIAPLPSGRSQ